jgi:hypothetical protein
MSSDEVLKHMKLLVTKVLSRDIIMCYPGYSYFELVPKLMPSVSLNKLVVSFVANFIIFI